MTSSRQSATQVSAAGSDAERQQRIAEAAERALAEAAARREALDSTTRAQPTEQGGQAGPDPARYGDWEKDGIVSDF